MTSFQRRYDFHTETWIHTVNGRQVSEREYNAAVLAADIEQQPAPRSSIFHHSA